MAHDLSGLHRPVGKLFAEQIEAGHWEKYRLRDDQLFRPDGEVNVHHNES